MASPTWSGFHIWISTRFWVICWSNLRNVFPLWAPQLWCHYDWCLVFGSTPACVTQRWQTIIVFQGGLGAIWNSVCCKQLSLQKQAVANLCQQTTFQTWFLILLPSPKNQIKQALSKTKSTSMMMTFHKQSKKILNKPNFARNSAKVLPAIKFQSALAHVGLGTDGTLFTLGWGATIRTMVAADWGCFVSCLFLSLVLVELFHLCVQIFHVVRIFSNIMGWRIRNWNHVWNITIDFE